MGTSAGHRREPFLFVESGRSNYSIKMAMSGIEIDPSIKTKFDELKLKKTHKFATFKISDDGKKVVIDQLGDPVATETMDDDSACFEKLKDVIVGNDPRYIIYDFGFVAKSGRKVEKLAFIYWCDDDNAPIKKKMVYSSTKDTIKKAFQGLNFEFQANCRGDLDYQTLADEVEKRN